MWRQQRHGHGDKEGLGPSPRTSQGIQTGPLGAQGLGQGAACPDFRAENICRGAGAEQSLMGQGAGPWRGVWRCGVGVQKQK